MKINFNMSAVLSNDNLSKSENSLSASIEKLSSGLKINHAKDSPSGIAIAKRMRAQMKGLEQANNNASDGISIINVAEGALTEVHDMLQRLNELSIKSANGTMSDGDRETVQEEVDSLLEEIDRIAESTEFNEISLLNGTFDLKGFPEKSVLDPTFNTASVKVESYSDETNAGFYEITIETGTKFRLKEVVDPETGLNAKDPITGDYLYEEDKNDPYTTIVDVKISTPAVAGTVDTTTIHGKTVNLESVANQTLVPSEDDDHTVTIKGDNNFSLTLDIDLDKFLAAGEDHPATHTVNVDLTGIGAMTIQIGSNEDQTLDVRIPTVSCKTLGVAELDVLTKNEAKHSIERISRAVNNLSTIRGRLGAYQNRLEHTVSSLDISVENLTGAYSRIMDTDMAEEMTEYTKDQVLSQAGTSMLAQANQRPSQILQLLQ